ncbi:hypothetical protein CICLE_v10003074mg [Citrus x clementina]|uniref:Uncharacterized protein n=1 Tax=Citrus clementina TaxID=85681 RepID=V4T8Z8_CITCL|nr:hypothetical protein CICLE_v10003074mg [Citrus x clementina]
MIRFGTENNHCLSCFTMQDSQVLIITSPTLGKLAVQWLNLKRIFNVDKGVCEHILLSLCKTKLFLF